MLLSPQGRIWARQSKILFLLWRLCWRSGRWTAARRWPPRRWSSRRPTRRRPTRRRPSRLPTRRWPTRRPTGAAATWWSQLCLHEQRLLRRLRRRGRRRRGKRRLLQCNLRWIEPLPHHVHAAHDTTGNARAPGGTHTRKHHATRQRPVRHAWHSHQARDGRGGATFCVVAGTSSSGSTGSTGTWSSQRHGRRLN